MNILFLPQTTQVGASSRIRIYQYLDHLRNEKVNFKIISGTSEKQDMAFLQNPNIFNKTLWFVFKILGRLFSVFQIRKFDCVFIHRETLPYFFPFTEIILSYFAKKMIFDFDDAIFIYRHHKGLLKRILFDEKNIQKIIEKSDRVIVSTNYLANYAKRFNRKVHIIPTSIDLDKYTSISFKARKNEKVVIGWIGSRSTREYLELLQVVLKELLERYDFIFKVIGAGEVHFASVPVINIEWKQETEIKEICSFDIGVMPLPNNKWTKGKGGFKLLQYMAAGVPSIASPVGVNREIIRDGENGFLASSSAEWLSKLSLLISNAKLRQRFSVAGTKTVAEKYSVAHNFPLWKDAITKF